MALSDTADGLSEKFLDAPDVYVGNINYCVQDTGFNIYLEFEDGSICSLAEINAALEENQ